MQLNSLILLVSLAMVLVFTSVAIYTLSRLASKLELLAIPGEHRLHDKATPMVGGIGIYLGLLVGLLLVDNSFSTLLPSLFLLCAVGAMDDRYKLPSWCRFLAQGCAAYLMLHLTGVGLYDLGYIFSTESRIMLAKPWSTLMTIFACVGVINAINMSDGLDGLAGSLVIVVLVALLINGHPSPGLILIAISAVMSFLLWNLRVVRTRAAVFMGDAGSTMLGLLLAYLLIQSSQAELGIWPVTALWLLALPLVDAVSVLIVRPLRGRSPFSADRNHYHHQLLDRGWSVNKILFISIVLQSLSIAAGLGFKAIGLAEHIQLLLFLSIFTLYLLRLYYFSGKPQKTA